MQNFFLTFNKKNPSEFPVKQRAKSNKQRAKSFTSKSTEELSFMTLKCHAKFDVKLTCASKTDMRNLANFHQSTQKSKNWNVDEILSSKVENV